MTFRAHDWRSFDNPQQVGRWDALASHASEPNPFFESWYLLPSFRAFRPRGARLLAFEVDGQLAGLIPLARTADYYDRTVPHMRGWRHANSFLGAPLVARELEPEFWQALLGWADAHCGSAAFLHLGPMPMEGTLVNSLRHALRRQQRPAALVRTEERALLQSDLSPEAYLEASLSTKKRKELRRQHRRLGEEGKLGVERVSNGEGVQRWAEQFLSLEMRGWKGEAGSALACAPETEQLFRMALDGAAQRGQLERLAVTLDGRPIAMLANFLSGRGAFAFKTAFDEDFARFSPGVLLQRENLALLDRAGTDWCDSCAATDHPMIDHFWRERRTVGHLNIAIGGPVRRGIFQILARLETGQAADFAR